MSPQRFDRLSPRFEQQIGIEIDCRRRVGVQDMFGNEHVVGASPPLEKIEESVCVLEMKSLVRDKLSLLVHSPNVFNLSICAGTKKHGVLWFHEDDLPARHCRVAGPAE